MYIWHEKYLIFQAMGKNIFGGFLLVFVLFSVQQLMAQDKFEKTVFEALKTGDATLIQSYFTSSIYLELPETRGTYSQNQARLMLDRFFAEKVPTDFKIKESGKAVDSLSSYYIGELITNDGSFTVYLIGKPEQEKIHSISITKMP